VHDGTRTVIVLLIDHDSPMAKGRLPIDAVNEESGIKARFDAVSYAANRASIGEFIPLHDVEEMFMEAGQQKQEKTSQNSNDGDHAK